jgi:dipeptidase
MCDTFTALANATEDGSVIFGKSADCEVNEAHHVVRFPAKTYPAGSAVRITHRLIPQVEKTNELLLCKSFWTWGGEMGINEHGLVIGNEALHTTISKNEKLDGIITMDLLRLGLERAKNCQEALDVMTGLLQTFGQGGNCEVSGNSHFDSSYIIADQETAWILETAGRKFAARQIDRYAAISNISAIDTNWQMCSLEKTQPNLNWAKTFGDYQKAAEGGAVIRQAASNQMLRNQNPKINLQTAFQILRTHDPENGVHTSICAHPSPHRRGEGLAVGAMVSQVKQNQMIAWVTATAATCLSIFKPVFLGAALPDMGPAPQEHFSPGALWWQHELLHRQVALLDFDQIMPEIRTEFDLIESEFIKESLSIIKETQPGFKHNFMIDCFEQARQATEKWIKKLQSRKIAYPETPTGKMWNKFNREAAFPF